MASILYEDIFSNFLGEVSDYEIVQLEQYEAMEILRELLRKALAESSLRKVFSSLKRDDNNQKLSFTLKHPDEDESSDIEFVINAITKFMVYEWWHKKVNNVTLTAHLIAGAEQKYYSQSAHLKELRESQSEALTTAKDYIVEHNFMFNDHLSGGNK